MDLYQIVGVSPSDSIEVIRLAFRAKAKTLHPDVGGDKDSFQRLENAYRILSDPERRRVYDVENGYHYSKTDFSKTDPVPLPVQEVVTTVTFDEMLSGSKTFTYVRRSEDGRYTNHITNLILFYDSGNALLRGVGDYSPYHQTFCDLMVRYNLVNIPPGITIDMAGNIHYTLKIGITRAILGGPSEIMRIGSLNLRLNIPPLTVHNSQLRVSHRGFPMQRTQPTDLIVRVEHVLPERLDSSAREALVGLHPLLFPQDTQPLS